MSEANLINREEKNNDNTFWEKLKDMGFIQARMENKALQFARLNLTPTLLSAYSNNSKHILEATEIVGILINWASDGCCDPSPKLHDH